MTLADRDLGFVGSYRLVKLLGRGKMGVVYKAHHLGLDRMLALKMIRNGQLASSQELARFRTEAKAVANLSHPGIVHVHEVGEHENQPYYTMDCVPGPSLSAILKQTLFAPTDSARLTLQIAEAVAHAHDNGVLHRDLKPANVLLDAEGHPRVADFGLAKRIHDELELTRSVVLGTLPGEATQKVELSTSMKIGGEEFNEMGFFVVETPHGHVGGLLPDTPGYAEAAFADARRQVIYSHRDVIQTQGSVTFEGGQMLGV